MYSQGNVGEIFLRGFV